MKGNRRLSFKHKNDMFKKFNIADRSRGGYFCKLCESHMTHLGSWKTHINSKWHLQNITKLNSTEKESPEKYTVANTHLKKSVPTLANSTKSSKLSTVDSDVIVFETVKNLVTEVVFIMEKNKDMINMEYLPIKSPPPPEFHEPVISNGKIFCRLCKDHVNKWQVHIRSDQHIQNFKKKRGPLGVPSNVKFLDSTKEALIQNEIKKIKVPIVGLNHITEYRRLNSIHTTYTCFLCHASLPRTQFMPHLTSMKHRLAYIRRVDLGGDIMIGTLCEKNFSLVSIVTSRASLLEAVYGRGKIEVKIEEQLANTLKEDQKEDKISDKKEDKISNKKEDKISNKKEDKISGKKEDKISGKKEDNISKWTVISFHNKPDISKGLNSCRVCGISKLTDVEWNRHVSRKMHNKNIEFLKKIFVFENKTHKLKKSHNMNCKAKCFCKLCESYIETANALKLHVDNKRHIKNFLDAQRCRNEVKQNSIQNTHKEASGSSNVIFVYEKLKEIISTVANELTLCKVTNGSKYRKISSPPLNFDIPGRSKGNYFCNKLNKISPGNLANIKFKDSKEDSLIIEEIKELDFPLIGLNHIIEYRRLNSIVPTYVCFLCDDVIQLSKLIFHLKSIEHRRAYIAKVDPGSNHMISILHKANFSLNKIISERISLLQAVYKQGKIKVKVEENLSGIPPKDDFSDSKEESFLSDTVEELKSPIVGLNFVTEYRYLHSDNPMYVCFLCRTILKNPVSQIVLHFSSMKHKYEYVKKFDPKGNKLIITLFMGGKDFSIDEVILRRTFLLETKFGRGKICVKIEKRGKSKHKKIKVEKKNKLPYDPSTIDYNKPDASKKLFFCRLCKIMKTNEVNWNHHIAGKFHYTNLTLLKKENPKLLGATSDFIKDSITRQEAKLQDPVSCLDFSKPDRSGGTYFCLICRCNNYNEIDFDYHILGKRHNNAIKAIRRLTFPDSDSKDEISLKKGDEPSELTQCFDFNTPDTSMNVYFCKLCRFAKVNEALWNSHLVEREHQQNLEALKLAVFSKKELLKRKNSISKPCFDLNVPDKSNADWVCKLCDCNVSNHDTWKTHVKSKEHMQNLNGLSDVPSKITFTHSLEEIIVLEKLRKIAETITDNLTVVNKSTLLCREPPLIDFNYPDRYRGTFYCRLCECHTNTETAWEKHLKTPRHQQGTQKTSFEFVTNIEFCDSCDVSLICDKIESADIPIIGLNHVVEYRYGNYTTYTCFLCNCSLPQVEILHHLTSISHKRTYIKKIDPKGDDMITATHVKGEELKDIITKRISFLESKYGQGNIRVKIENDKIEMLKSPDATTNKNSGFSPLKSVSPKRNIEVRVSNTYAKKLKSSHIPIEDVSEIPLPNSLQRENNSSIGNFTPKSHSTCLEISAKPSFTSHDYSDQSDEPHSHESFNNNLITLSRPSETVSEIEPISFESIDKTPSMSHAVAYESPCSSFLTSEFSTCDVPNSNLIQCVPTSVVPVSTTNAQTFVPNGTATEDLVKNLSSKNGKLPKILQKNVPEAITSIPNLSSLLSTPQVESNICETSVAQLLNKTQETLAKNRVLEMLKLLKWASATQSMLKQHKVILKRISNLSSYEKFFILKILSKNYNAKNDEAEEILAIVVELNQRIIQYEFSEMFPGIEWDLAKKFSTENASSETNLSKHHKTILDIISKTLKTAKANISTNSSCKVSSSCGNKLLFKEKVKLLLQREGQLQKHKEQFSSHKSELLLNHKSKLSSRRKWLPSKSESELPHKKKLSNLKKKSSNHNEKSIPPSKRQNSIDEHLSTKTLKRQPICYTDWKVIEWKKFAIPRHYHIPSSLHVTNKHFTEEKVSTSSSTSYRHSDKIIKIEEDDDVCEIDVKASVFQSTSCNDPRKFFNPEINKNHIFPVSEKIKISSK